MIPIKKITASNQSYPNIKATTKNVTPDMIKIFWSVLIFFNINFFSFCYPETLQRR